MAVQRVAGDKSAPIAFLCEHASNRMPSGWHWPEADRWMTDTHWAVDLGAEDLTRELADHFRSPATLADFTRLLIDPNRPEASSTLFRDRADGVPVAMNEGLESAERERRLEELYRPYHREVGEMVGSSDASILFSVHSFTPLYEGEERTLEVGVLWDAADDLNHRFAEYLRDDGFVVACNEPYSGKDGFAFSVETHAGRHARRAIEIEVRQDLCVRPEVRRRVVLAVERLVRSVV